MNELVSIIDKYKKYTQTNDNFVFNENLNKIDFNKIKFIIVGDNPGKEEKEEKIYFIGISGKILRNFFKEKLNIEFFCKKSVIFNKTPYHTSSTEELTNINKELIEESMKVTAETINKISEKLNLPILIFGKSKLKNTFKPFLKEINYDFVYIYSHPSYGNLSREWNKFVKKNAINGDKLEQFFKLGKENADKIKI